MARPPNYKQDKKRREDAQKKRNEQEQSRLTRKPSSPTPVEHDRDAPAVTPKIP